MERLYAFLLRSKNTIYQFTFAYTIGIISGILGEGEFKTIYDLFVQFNPQDNLSLILMYGLLVFSLLITIVYYGLAYYCKTKESSAVLSNQMERNTEPYFEKIGFQGGYSWASNRTLIVCDNIFVGWKPESILIEELDVADYSFKDTSNQLNDAYNKFMNSSYAKSIIEHNNNLDRVMLTNISQNFNKNDKRIYLSLKKTNWCTNCFLWDYMKNNPDFKVDKIGDLYSGKGKILPNSLCLHLILVTKDNKIILTRVSSNKRNDYPSTWAATIGEQLEISDIIDGVNYKDKFILKWTKRALAEEFGFSADKFDVIADTDSLRVLAFDVEGDIYNISLATTLKLRCNFSEFTELLRKTPDSEKELSEIKAITYDEVLNILYNYKNNKNDYHPSTFLRLYLCYIHRYGVDCFIDKYKKLGK